MAFCNLGGGGWIWTNDLLVMGQTSYQTALPRDDAIYFTLIQTESQAI